MRRFAGYIGYGVSLILAISLRDLMENDLVKFLSWSIPVVLGLANFIANIIALRDKVIKKLADVVAKEVEGKIVDDIWYRIDSRYGILTKTSHQNKTPKKGKKHA